MLKTLCMIFPVLIPSWRFFKSIEPSPRVEWALFSAPCPASVVWHPFRPRPLIVTPLQMVLHLFWNHDRNDALFVVSCSERIQQQPTQHSITEIMRRIHQDIQHMHIDTKGKLLQFRLVFVHREQAALVEEVVFVSDAVPASTRATL